MLFNEFHHLLLRPGVYASLNGDSMFLAVILDQLVRAETLMALLTVHQRIRKSTEMS